MCLKCAFFVTEKEVVWLPSLAAQFSTIEQPCCGSDALLRHAEVAFHYQYLIEQMR